MAFCNSCGNSLEAGAKFCPKCGAATLSASSAVSAPAAPVAPAQGSGVLKIILIVVAVIVGLGILGAGTMAFLVHRAISRTHFHQQNGEVRVDTPFGSVESTQDPNEAARNVGVDIYPGATVVQGGAANMTFGGMHTAAVEFESGDPPSAVADFYKSKFPSANFMSSDGGRYTILAGDKGNMTTINIEPRDGKTRIHVAKVTGKMAGTSSN